MVCSCGDLCNCEENCTCRLVCNICHTALQQNECSHLFPLRESNPRNSKNGAKLCEHCTFRDKVNRNESEASCLIAEEHESRCSMELQNNKSEKCFIQSSHNSLSDTKKSPVSKNEYARISEEEQGTSHFSILKLKIRKFKSRLKRTKKKSNDSRHIFLVLDDGSDTSDELAQETESTTDGGDSPIEKPLENTENTSSENLQAPCHKAGNVSKPSQNLYQNVHTKSFAIFSNDECDSFFNNKFNDNTELYFGDNEVSKEDSFLYSKDFYKSSVTSLHSNALLTTEQSSEDVVLINEYDESSEDEYELSEVAKHKNLEENECPILPQSSNDFVTNKVTFYVGSDKSWSSSDENLAVPLYSNYPNINFPQSSNLYERSLSTDVIKERKFFKQSVSSDNLLKSTKVTNSKSPTTSSNEYSATTRHSSFTSQKLKQKHRSISLSQVPSLASNARFSSTRSLTTRPRSLSERFRQGSPSTNDCHEKNTETSTLLCESSDLEDFVNLNMELPANLSESESISSSEFLPCKYCRSVSHCPLITDSVIPYHPLE